jgi:hypothetical protein
MIIKNSHKSTTTKKVLIISGVIIVLIAIPVTYVYAFNGSLFGWQKPTTEIINHDQKSVNYEPATPEQQKAGTTIKSGSTDTPPAPTVIPGSDKKNVQITITAANQNESTLQIRTLISAVEGTGVCTLTLTSAGKPTVTKTSDSQALASISTCQGFDIPISELPVGTWHAVIDYSSTALTGSANQDIVVK